MLGFRDYLSLKSHAQDSKPLASLEARVRPLRQKCMSQKEPCFSMSAEELRSKV